MIFRSALFALFFLLIARPARVQADVFGSCIALVAGEDYAGFVRAGVCLHAYLRSADTPMAKALLSRLSDAAAERRNPYIPLFVRWAYVEHVLSHRDPWPVDSMMENLADAVAEAKRLGDAPSIAWTECNVATFQFGTGRCYDQAFETALRVYRRARGLSDTRMPDRGEVLGIIANFYYYFAEYRQAISILTEAVGGPPTPVRAPSVGRRCYNTLGLCYRQLGRYDSSDYCFQQALREAHREGDPAWVSIIRGNLGINLYRRGRFAEAAPLLAEDVRASLARADFDNAAGSLLPLAGIALEERNLPKASAMLDTARYYIARHDADARLPLYHSLRIREAAAQGDAIRAAAHADSRLAGRFEGFPCPAVQFASHRACRTAAGWHRDACKACGGRRPAAHGHPAAKCAPDYPDAFIRARRAGRCLPPPPPGGGRAVGGGVARERRGASCRGSHAPAVQAGCSREGRAHRKSFRATGRGRAQRHPPAAPRRDYFDRRAVGRIPADVRAGTRGIHRAAGAAVSESFAGRGAISGAGAAGIFHEGNGRRAGHLAIIGTGDMAPAAEEAGAG